MKTGGPDLDKLSLICLVDKAVEMLGMLLELRRVVKIGGINLAAGSMQAVLKAGTGGRGHRSEGI